MLVNLASKYIYNFRPIPALYSEIPSIYVKYPALYAKIPVFLRQNLSFLVFTILVTYVYRSP